MAALDTVGRVVSFATLRETRARLRTWWGRLLFVSVSIVYAFVSMILGQMLIFGPTGRTDVIWYIYTNGNPWWNYPGLILIAPNATLALPFFATLAMALVSIGVGIGGTIGLVLVLPFFRRRESADKRTTAVGSAAALSPAITGLATLGACCCTSCAGLVGISVVAAASGSSLNSLLLNNWYIGVFQVGVVYVSLLAMERTLRLTAEYCPVPPPIDRRFVAGALLRLGLLIAGITWSLAMFVEWSDNPPLRAAAPIWYHWIFEHQLLSLTAISAGLFPKEFALGIRRIARAFPGGGLRVTLAVAGISWGLWVPPALVAIGLGGFLNELFGFVGLPVGFGAVPPDASLGLPLYFHWSFQHLLLAGFALGIAIAPLVATAPLLWTVSGGRSVGAPEPVTTRPPSGSARPGDPVTAASTPDPTREQPAPESYARGTLRGPESQLPNLVSLRSTPGAEPGTV